MSVRMITRAYDYGVEHELNPSRRLLLVTMADAADDDGRLWPSQKRLRVLTGLGLSTMREILREFEEAGILSTELRNRDGGRGRTSNLYRLNLLPPGSGDRSHEQPPAAGADGHVLPPAAGGGAPQELAVEAPAAGGGIYREPSVEPSVEPHTQRGRARDVPGEVIRSLEGVSKRKGAELDLDAVARVLADFPDVDLADQVRAFERFHLDGRGQRSHMAVIDIALRRWLEGAHPRRVAAAPAILATRGPGWRSTKTQAERRRDAIAANVDEPSPAIAAAWSGAREALRSSELFDWDVWIEPLQLVGVSGGDLVVLHDTAEQGGWAAGEERMAIERALSTAAGVELLVQVCDAAELGLALEEAA